jgi:hypothetical protein
MWLYRAHLKKNPGTYIPGIVAENADKAGELATTIFRNAGHKIGLEDIEIECIGGPYSGPWKPNDRVEQRPEE